MVGRPNILLITTDEERFTLPRPAGYSLPARERLAESGVTFDRFYGASAMCSSARSVLYTGRHVPITEVYDNDNMPHVRPLDPALGTLGTMLRAAGYYTTYQGKWHLSNAYLDPTNPVPNPDALEPYGFSAFNDWGDVDGGAWAGLRIDPMVAGQAARWLHERADEVAAERPWCMTVNFVNPHDIMSFDYGLPPLMKAPPVLEHAFVMKPPAPIPVYRRTWDLALPDSLRDDLSDAAPAVREFAAMIDTAFGRVGGEDDWLAGLNYYLNCLRDVDRSIELVLDALEASGQSENTIVVLTADHGEMVGSHGLRQKGNLVYDENFHVPFVVRHPDFEGGTATGALASAVDVVPTLLELAGAEVVLPDGAPALAGHSLVPALEQRQVRDGVLTAVESVLALDAGFWAQFGAPDMLDRLASGDLRPDWAKRGFLRGYTDERYTFGRYFSPLQPNRPASLEALHASNDVVLYDRQDDPSEVRNLAADPAHRDLVEAYRAKLEALIDDEIGADTRAWVGERPQLLGWPSWKGDRPRPERTAA
jgi:arylsulfatase